ncbi:hypothetical protein ACE6H2_002556 [Prunus campanulata]
MGLGTEPGTVFVELEFVVVVHGTVVVVVEQQVSDMIVAGDNPFGNVLSVDNDNKILSFELPQMILDFDTGIERGIIFGVYCFVPHLDS